MKTLLFGLSALLVLSACTLFDPYSVTFTTQDRSTVNPETDTLDLALNQEALAYISRVQCEDDLPIEILPIVNDETNVAKAHNLPLTILGQVEQGSLCRVTVTAFDRTTTSSGHGDIDLYVLTDGSEEPEPEVEPEPEPEEEVVEEAPVVEEEAETEIEPEADVTE